MSMVEAVSRTGVGADAIKALARAIAAERPTVVITQDANPAVSALNVLLGSVGVRGGIVRSTTSARSMLAAVPEMPNARAVLIDASVPWDFLPRTDAEVFRFAAWDSGSSLADWLLPAPGFVEETTDVPTAPASAVESYAIATSLVKATSDVRSAAQFLMTFDSSLVSAEKVIQKRCEELYQKRNGSVYSSEITPVSKVPSAAKFEEELRKGAVWVGDASPPGRLRCELKEWPAEARASKKVEWASSWDLPVLPTLTSKLYIESTLRESPGGRNV
jgi:hypothetical protein